MLPMILLQVMQLLSQHCYLPLPELASKVISIILQRKSCFLYQVMPSCNEVFVANKKQNIVEGPRYAVSLQQIHKHRAVDHAIYRQ